MTPARRTYRFLCAYGQSLLEERVVIRDRAPFRLSFAVPLNFSMLPEHLGKLGYESHAVGATVYRYLGCSFR